MNKSFENLEYRRATGHNYRVGYARTGEVFHVTGRTGNYYARSTRPQTGLGAFYATSLAQVSAMLRSR